MTRVGTLAESNQILQYLQQSQSQSNDLETQITTGLKSQTFAGIAPQSAQLIDLNAQKSKQQSFMDTIDTVNTRLQTMSLALNNIESLASGFVETVSNDAFNTEGGATIQVQAQQVLLQIGGYLNTQDGSRYVFSGNQTSTPTFDPNGLPNPGNLSVPVSGAPPAGYYGGDNGVAQAQIDNSVNLSYGVTGDNPAFEQVIRVLNFFANSPPLDPNNPADAATVDQAESLLNSGVQQLQQLAGTAGLQVGQLSTTRAAHQNTLNLAETSIQNIEQVDPATAITQLNTLQTQLEASYQTIGTLQQLSLANFLK